MGDDESWKEDLKADIALIRGAKVSTVLTRRLDDVLNGRNAGKWPRFSAGESGYTVERDGFHVIIRFTRPGSVEGLCKQLDPLRDRFKAITAITSAPPSTPSHIVTIVVRHRP
jgi:hypothetical protein